MADTWPAKGKGSKANFTPACNKHDVCYGTCKKDKDACDKAFCTDLLKACKKTWPDAEDSKRRGCEARADFYCVRGHRRGRQRLLDRPGRGLSLL